MFWGIKPQIYNRKDFVKGQTVYLLIEQGSNESRYITDKDNRENWIKEAVVQSVGTKMLTVKTTIGYREVKFNMTNE